MSNYLLGKIKWYGGLNRKTGKQNKFGFISTPISNEDYIVYEKDVISSPCDLRENTEVIFIEEKTLRLIHGKKVDAKKAVQVQVFSETKYAVIRNKLKEIDSLFDFNPSTNCYNIYTCFTDSDIKLAKLWTESELSRNTNNSDGYREATETRMLSARGAELSAIRFYKELGYQVEDISIKQLNYNESEWINCDISLDNEIKIDVKNARTSINNPNGYSEVYVPKYKEDIKGNAVRISGVLSPARDKYLRPYRGTTQNITFLGETSLEKIQYLTQQYNSHGILELTLSRNGDKGFIAPWLFDYPEPFYRKRNAWRTEMAELLKSEYVTVVKSLFSSDYYSACIMAGIKLPTEIIDKFDFWTRAFYEKIISEKINSLTLPKLFLLILTEFLEQVKQNPSDEYRPWNYRKVLYLSELHRLGIYDPLNIIDNLVDSLDTLFIRNKNSDYSDYSLFIGFKLTGAGLLYGKLANGKTKTLLAYCGGKIETRKNVACGYKPLIYGREETCEYCGKLVCPCENCKFCSDNCYGWQQRKTNQMKIINS